MPGPSFKATLRLLSTAEGRKGPIFSDYRPSWNLGNTWHGEPTLNDGRVFPASKHTLDKRMSSARQRLLELYEAGTKLPYVEPPEGIEAPAAQLPQEWPGFDRFEMYWEVFDPYDASEPVCGSLSDDILGVYGDVQPGLALWALGETTNQSEPRIAAIWEWRFGFDSHWGDHAVDALRALHRACRM